MAITHGDLVAGARTLVKSTRSQEAPDAWLHIVLALGAIGACLAALPRRLISY